MQALLQPRNDTDAAQADTVRRVVQNGDLADNRLEAVAQRKLTKMMNNSPRVFQQGARSDAIHYSPRMVAQRHQVNALFGGAVKPQGDSVSPAEASPAQREKKANHTGLPDQLKSGIESLSDMSMDHVQVHYNSDKPAQLQAHAYAKGSDIFLAPGQERYLPHEPWHVVQQAQGRVRPTLQMKGETSVNDEQSLEHEADLMGAKAAALRVSEDPEQAREARPTVRAAAAPAAHVQRVGIKVEELAVLTIEGLLGLLQASSMVELLELTQRLRMMYGKVPVQSAEHAKTVEA